MGITCVAIAAGCSAVGIGRPSAVIGRAISGENHVMGRKRYALSMYRQKPSLLAAPTSQRTLKMHRGGTRISNLSNGNRAELPNVDSRDMILIGIRVPLIAERPDKARDDLLANSP